MPKLFDTPKKYEMPTPGDVWQKELNDGEWERGIVVGVKPRYHTTGPKKGEMSSWTAHITSGFRDYRQDVAWDKTYQITEQWHPAPAEKQAPTEVRALFQDLVGRVEHRLASVEENHTSAFAALREDFRSRLNALEERFNIAESKLVEANREFARLHERINASAHPAPAPVKDPTPTLQPPPPPAEPPKRPSRTATSAG